MSNEPRFNRYTVLLEPGFACLCICYPPCLNRHHYIEPAICAPCQAKAKDGTGHGEPGK